MDLKTFKLFFIIGVFSILIVGCSNDIENKEESLIVQKRIGDENNYEDFREVTDNEQVQKLKEILKECKLDKCQSGNGISS